MSKIRFFKGLGDKKYVNKTIGKKRNKNTKLLNTIVFSFTKNSYIFTKKYKIIISFYHSYLNVKLDRNLRSKRL